MAEAEDIDADAEDDGGGSGAAVAAARTGQAPCSEGGKVCSNCGTANAARYQRVKESGELLAEEFRCCESSRWTGCLHWTALH